MTCNTYKRNFPTTTTTRKYQNQHQQQPLKLKSLNINKNSHINKIKNNQQKLQKPATDKLLKKCCNQVPSFQCSRRRTLLS